jgi:hypothetical protein
MDIENRVVDPTQDLSLAPRRPLKRGNGAKPLLESEIRVVQQKARSAKEAARILGVCYNTYKKWARLYGIFEDLKNPTGIGISKKGGKKGTISLDSILRGEHPNYDIHVLKRRLLLNGYIEEKCSICGFSERRITDYRVPLVLVFDDGDKHNHKYENLRMVCFNCFFLTYGNLMGPRRTYYY